MDDPDLCARWAPRASAGKAVRGALASSVGHDSHNLCVVGADDADLAVAANWLIALGGGFVAVRSGTLVAELALPVAGLVSLRSFEDVAHDLERLRVAEREMGCLLAEPFLHLMNRVGITEKTVGTLHPRCIHKNGA
jgi:adenine deaminase